MCTHTQAHAHAHVCTYAYNNSKNKEAMNLKNSEEGYMTFNYVYMCDVCGYAHVSTSVHRGQRYHISLESKLYAT